MKTESFEADFAVSIQVVFHGWIKREIDGVFNLETVIVLCMRAGGLVSSLWFLSAGSCG